MKIYKNYLMLILLTVLAGCSSTTPSPSELYKTHNAQTIYSTAKTYFAKGQYANAVKAYEALDALYPASPYRESAHMNIIDAYYKAEDNASAITAADCFIRWYPRSQHLDYVYYMKGVSELYKGMPWYIHYTHMDLSKRDLTSAHLAFKDFETVATSFPNSHYAPDARQRMIYLQNIFAQAELNVARFYMQKKAYVAAANRATYVIVHYRSTPAAKEASTILAEANHALGLLDRPMSS